MAQRHHAAALRVTVVDDDPAVCSSLKFSLELDGFVVRTYSGGGDLLAAADLHDCDCFVIDQRMQGMSGIELIGRLRERKATAPVILVVSSHPNSALSARAAAAQIPIVEKPFLGNALLDKIREACRQA